MLNLPLSIIAVFAAFAPLFTAVSSNARVVPVGAILTPDIALSRIRCAAWGYNTPANLKTISACLIECDGLSRTTEVVSGVYLLGRRLVGTRLRCPMFPVRTSLCWITCVTPPVTCGCTRRPKLFCLPLNNTRLPPDCHHGAHGQANGAPLAQALPGRRQ